MRRGRLADEREIAREYRVVVRSEGARTSARLEFQEPSGEAKVRDVVAKQCDEAVRAIALVTALAIDAAMSGGPAEAAVAEGSAESPNEPAPSSAAPAPSNPTAQRSVRSPPPVSAPAAPPPPAGQDAFAPRESPSPATPIAFSLGARGTLTSPKAPRPLFGAEVFAAVSAEDASWLVQLSIAAETGARVEKGPGEARFSFLGARLSGCAFPIRLGARVRVAPCAVAEAGVVEARGYIQTPATNVDPWFSLSPTARLSLDFARLGFSLEAGPTFPLRRDAVVFGDVQQPEAVVHEVPPVGLFLAGGIGFAL